MTPKITIHNSYLPENNKINGDLENFKKHSAPPSGYKRISNNDLPPEATQIAKSLLKNDFGTLTPFDINDRSFIARVEPHYHEPGGKNKPWGVHKGVSVFENSNKKLNVFQEEEYANENGLLAKLNKFLTNLI